MEISYRQDINHNYMIIRKEGTGPLSFQEKMLLHNTIAGLLKMSIQHLNGETFYCYDIRSRQAITNFFEGKRLSAQELLALLSGFAACTATMGNYLLSASSLMMKPECIFWDLETDAPVFCCYPENNGKEGEQYLEFAQFLIDHVDEEDENAVRLSYNYYQQTADGIFSPEALLKREGGVIPRETAAPPRPETEYSPLPVESLWKDEEHTDYSDATLPGKETPSVSDRKQTKQPMAALFLLMILLPLGGYAFLAFHPETLESFGLTRDQVLLFGGIAALLLAGGLIGMVTFFTRRPGKTGLDPLPAPAEATAPAPGGHFLQDSLEEEEHRSAEEKEALRAYSGQTVLLTDFPGEAFRPVPQNPLLLWSKSGEQEKTEIGKSPFMIGKLAGHADLVIADPRISRLHACIRREGTRFFLSDLNSTNGTFVNGRRLEQNEAAALEDGDMIRLAGISLQFTDSCFSSEKQESY